MVVVVDILQRKSCNQAGFFVVLVDFLIGGAVGVCERQQQVKQGLDAKI